MSAFYDLSLIAATGEQTSAGGQITGIDPLVSMNDSGVAAFAGTVTNGSALFSDDGAAATKIIGFPPMSNRIYSFPKINNAGDVVVREQLSPPGFPPNNFIRAWPADGSGSTNGAPVLINNSPAEPGPDGVYNSVLLPTIANDGGVAFVGFTDDSSFARLYYIAPGESTAEAFTDLTGGGGFRPIAADNGNLLVRTGAGTTGKLMLNDTVIASTDSRLLPGTVDGWDAIGPAAGISDDGTVVVFYGNVSAALADRINRANGDVAPVPVAPGPGIFASIEVGGTRHIVRVAGESGNGFIDPGERRTVGTTDDIGPDFNFDRIAEWQIGAGGFSVNSRVGVTNPRDFTIAADGQFVTVAYHADDTVDTAGPAIYTSRINLFKDAGNTSAIGVEAPIQVAKIGQGIDGFGTIQDVALYDPINNNGEIVFWARTAGGAAVVKAVRDSTENITVNGNPRVRFDPDSPLAEYIAEGQRANNNVRRAFNQVVIHATAGREPTDFQNLTTGLSAHYYVTRQGRVVQIIRESDVATHSGTPYFSPPAGVNTNQYSIGIELEDGHRGDGNGAGHREDANWAMDIQLKKTALLVRDIALRHGIPLQHLAILPADLFPAPANRPQNSAGDRPHGTAFVAPAGPVRAFEVLGTYSQAPFGPTVDDNGNPIPTTRQFAQDGYEVTETGILAHGQVYRRTKDKDDPRVFEWIGFMTRVNQGIGLTLNSPANLLVTDPQGRRVGVVPGTGQVVNEIPGASFSGPGTEPQSLAIPGGIEGQYQVQVVGTAAGVYHLDLYAASHAGELMRTQVADQTSAGAITSYTLNYTTVVDARATVTAAANLPPVAFDDRLITRGEDPVQIPVVINDSDPEGLLDVATVAITDPPDSGVTSIDPITGIITYTPNPGFVGDDSFQYQVRDTAGLASGIATVLVHVFRETIAPVAADDTATTAFETPIIIDVLSNDSDPDGTLDPTSVRLGHDGEPINGTIAFDPETGDITFVPDLDFIGVGSFDYEVLDNDGAASNAARVTITVLPPDGPEIAVTLGGSPIVDGDASPDGGDGTDFGVAGQNVSGSVRMFTVRNLGSASLTLGPVSVPSGFALVEPLVASLDAGGSDTFSVQLITSALGTFGGAVTFSTSDANENPFNFTVAGEVTTLPGSLDLTFGGGDGWVTSPWGTARNMVVLPDGKILVGGTGGTFYSVARYNPNGTVDTTFGGGDGLVQTEFSGGDGRSALLLPDGKILLVGGTVSRFELKPGIGVARYNADGTPDNTFGDFGVVIRFDGLVNNIAEAVLQPDGKIVVVGRNINPGNPDFAVARLNANGTVDTTFGGGDGLATADFGANDAPLAVVVQPDGKIVVAGVANESDVGLARFNADGTLDATFGGGDGLVTSDLLVGANDVALLPDGRIVVVGGGGSGIAIARYNTDGAPDTGFGADGFVSANVGLNAKANSVALQPDGKILVAGSAEQSGIERFGFLLARFHIGGSLDTAFDGDGVAIRGFLGLGGVADAVVIQPNGKIIVAGSGMARFNGDHSALPAVTLTTTDAEGSETGPDNVRFTVTRTGDTDQPLTVFFQLQSDGVAGQATLGRDFRMSPGATQVTIPAGSVTADITLTSLLDANLESDELITLEILHGPSYAIGLPFIADGIIRGECDEIILNGELDPTFGGGDGLATTEFDIGFNRSIAMALAPDGKLLVASRVSTFQTTSHAVARFRTNGLPDPSFGKAGLVVTPLSDRAGTRTRIAVQFDGKVIVAGVIDSTSLNFGMVRYLPNGSLDTTFGGGDGVVETDFGRSGPTPHDYLTSIFIQPDGKILLAGGIPLNIGDESQRIELARYNSDGSLDAAFGEGGLVTTYVANANQIQALVLQPDGKIVAVASFDPDSFARGETDFAVLRYNLDGSLDTTFGGGKGYVTESVANTDRARDVAVQADGKIVVVGDAITIAAIGGNRVDGFVARYNADGSPDTTFGAGDGLLVEAGASASEHNAGYAVELQPDGKIILVGCEDNAVAAVRYDSNGMRDTTFGGGDGLVTLPGVAGYGHIVDAALQPDGKLVIGRTTDIGFPLFRLTGDCIVPQPVVAGVKFQDFDGDGMREAGESGLAGWEIRAYADLDVNGHLDATDLTAGIKASTISDENGEYELSFPAGHYVIVEVAQPGWTQSFPAGSVNEVDPSLDEFGYAVSLNFGQMSAARDFGSSSTTSTNRAPVLDAIVDRNVEVGQTVTFIAAAADPDSDNLTFSLAAGAPAGAAIDPVAGEFSWIPQATHAGQSFSITIRVTDDGQPALSDVESFTITVAAEGNQPPALDPIADRVVEIGQTVTFTATASDPDGDDLVFTLDAGAPAGATINAQTGQFSFAPTTSQAGQVFSITVRVADDGSPALSDTETFDVTVQPQVEPQFTLSAINGPDVGVPGQLRSYSVTFTDPNSIGNYTTTINWGDGVVDSGVMSTQTSGGVTTGVVSFWHTYTTIDDRNVRLTLTDGQGNQLIAQKFVTVQLVTFQPDPLDASRRALVAGGYEGVNEEITFNPDGPGVNVMYRDYNHGRFMFDGSVIAFGQSGNDSIRVHPSLTNTAMLFGQAGDDLLVAGAGASVLVGGAGNDTLHGSALRDLLFGGLGADLLHGIAPDRAGATDEGDLIASDVTAWEYDPNLLASIFDRWSSANSYADRLTNLRYLQSPALNNTKVFDDFAADRFFGGAGLDWFVFFSTDLVIDPEAGEEGLGVRL